MDLEATLASLLDDLDVRWGVEVAWLFGSQIRGARPDSDIDLAILFRSHPDPVALFDARGELERIAGRGVDVVDLDRASPVIAFQALKNGRLIADNNRRRRIDFTAALPGRYEDIMRVRKSIEQAMLRRVSHGRT